VLRLPTTILPFWSPSTSLTHPSSSNEVVSVYLPRCGCMSRCSSRLAHCVVCLYRAVVALEPPSCAHIPFPTVTRDVHDLDEASLLTCLRELSIPGRRLRIEQETNAPTHSRRWPGHTFFKSYPANGLNTGCWMYAIARPPRQSAESLLSGTSVTLPPANHSS
jgi:hypothetical protein